MSRWTRGLAPSARESGAADSSTVWARSGARSQCLRESSIRSSLSKMPKNSRTRSSPRCVLCASPTLGTAWSASTSSSTSSAESPPPPKRRRQHEKRLSTPSRGASVVSPERQRLTLPTRGHDGHARGSFGFARVRLAVRMTCNYGVSANSSERARTLLTLAMQKVVGSSPIIRLKPQGNLRFSPREISGTGRVRPSACIGALGPGSRLSRPPCQSEPFRASSHG